MKKFAVILLCLLAIVGMATPKKSLVGARGVGNGGENLPYDAKVEYIHIPSGGYFDTGWKNFTTTNVTISILMAVNQFNAAFDTYFGGYEYPNDANAIVLRRSSTSSNLQAYMSSKSGSTLIFTPSAGFSEYLFDRGVFSINGTVKINGYTGFFLNNPIIIGGASHGQGDVLLTTSDFFLSGFHGIDEDGATVLDLIPVRIKNEQSETEGAMYDCVSGVMFRNQGTGTFEPGPDRK